jgi:predicted transglutaminase-like cysteine proteinase
MSTIFNGIAAAVIFAVANISAAAAFPASAPMFEGAYALAPFSFVKFCIDYPDECPKQGGPGRIRLTRRRISELLSVNSAVNSAIVAMPDTSALRYWKLNVDAGDCNAFAVQKRHELIERGWAAAALALTVAKTSWGEGHLVVTVRTDRGDFVLDNLRRDIVPWQRTGYRWIMRQSERNPQYWVELHGGRPGTVSVAQDLDDATPLADGAEDAANVALDEAKASAVTASISGLAHWIDDNRQALMPGFRSVADALEGITEESSAGPPKVAGDESKEAKAVDPIDPTRFGFI